ncbi:N-acetyltransferase [Psychromonas sp.]|uniref:N-acetyltransferase n=1 Tax=Psychromonas sp. TaxID=1884585 RepID=UPI0035618E2D
MIRSLRLEDLDIAVSIWFSASIKAHDFISEEYWSSQKQNMRELYLPNCESWVYESAGNVLGFISYYEGSIPAIFVDPKSQSQGIGTQLLDHLKNNYSKLALTVYAENEKTHQFYIHQGFSDVGRCTCEHTGHEQFKMCWIKNGYA